MTPQFWPAAGRRKYLSINRTLARRRSRPLALEPLEGRQVLATFFVNSFADTIDANVGDGLALDAAGNTSLRAAIMEANALAGADTIQLEAGNYALTRTSPNESAGVSGDLDIRDDLTILGAGAGLTTINAAAVNDRVFEVLAALIQRNSTTFHLEGVTLTGGLANQLDSLSDRGGAMRLDLKTSVTVVDCVFTGNRAPDGGAPLFRAGAGGAIFSDGNLTIDGCRFENNVAGRYGGAIFVNASFTLTTIRNSTFTGNSAVFGGAIRMTQAVVVENSTFSGNVARNAAGTSGQGGAIENTGGNLTLTSVTISGNDSFSGGGVFMSSAATTRLNHATVAFNTANYGGGLHAGGTTSIENTIVARNTAAVASQGHDVRGAMTSLGYNLVGNTTASSGFTAAGDLVNVDPLLGTLADNGGLTFTHALLSGSPAGDAANPNSTVSADQRGLGRPRDVDGDAVFRADIGAFEVQAVWPPLVVVGGPYAVEEGGSVGLSASGSQSRQVDPTLSFAWDFDGDGQFDDATGATPTFSAVGFDGPAVVTVAVRVTDSLGLFADGSATVNVGNVAPVVGGINLTPSANWIVGSPISLVVQFTDAGQSDTHTATIVWGDGGSGSGQVSQSAGGGSVSGVHTFAAGGNYTIVVTVTDDDGASGSSSITLFVAGPPAADAGGPYTVSEGGSVSLSGSGGSQQTDPTLSFAWDFDGDGQFDDASGATPTFSAAGFDGPVTVTVAVRVTDSQGLTSDDTATISVTNATPMITGLNVTPPTSGTSGTPVSLVVQFTDAGIGDTHQVSIQWGDGGTSGASVTESGGSGSGSASHTYGAAGTYTIVVTVTDDDGAATSTQVSYVVQPSGGGGGGSVVLVGGVLKVTGTDGADRVAIHRSRNGKTLLVDANFLPGGRAEFAIKSVKQIVAHFGNGNDILVMDKQLPIAIVADGGAGNDILAGGGRNDILIGGSGADYLLGLDGDDLLVAGTTDHDQNDDALLRLLSEWNAGGKYETRVRNIWAGTGKFLRNTGIRLAYGSTVHDDDGVDRLMGNGGRDWFFADLLLDRLLDRKRDEQINNGPLR